MRVNLTSEFWRQMFRRRSHKKGSEYARRGHRARYSSAFDGSGGRSDEAAVFAAGWDDHALHDAAAICGLFNLMNRLVDGLGIEADAAHTQFVAQRLATTGYAGFLSLLPEAKRFNGGGD
jgi:hypothetical protein